MKNTTRRGFTLIELLIVVAIIGLLASVVLVGLGGFRSAGRDTRRVQDLKLVQNGLELFFRKCNFYPGDAPGGVCNSGTNPTPDPAGWALLEATLQGANISVPRIPSDPLSGGSYPNYTYAVDTSDNLRYILGAQLEDANNPALRDSVIVNNPFGSSLACGTGVIYCIASE